MSKWSEFYSRRMGPGYRRYFQQKYDVFLKILEEEIHRNDFVVEKGCGMATTTRILMDRWTPAFAYEVEDIDPAMLKLAKKNCPRVTQKQRDVCDRHPEWEFYAVVHSHGLLEHLPDWKIQRMVDVQRLDGVRTSIHYVPSSKYEKPSFGDERLMTPEDWRRIGNPTEIVPFNDGYDLALIWRFQ